MIKVTSLKVDLSLKKTMEYLDLMRGGHIKNAAASRIKTSLAKHLWTFVFTDDVKKIWDVPDAAAMRAMIRNNTRPSRSTYDEDYLRRKMYMRPPHNLSHGKAFRENTFIDRNGGVVTMHIPATATTRSRTTKAGVTHTFNFGPIHEQRKSILKSTIVFAWQNIRKRVRETYRDYIDAVK